MYLRDLAAGATWKQSTPERLAFNESTLCISLEFLRALPRRKIILDNLAKLNIFVGEAGPDNETYNKWQGVGNVYVPSFDFSFYLGSSRTEQQETVLQLYKEAINLVANRTSSDASLCYSTIEHVRSLGLPLPDISVQDYIRAFRRGGS